MSANTRRAAKIMVIRHAEKPSDSPPPHGVTAEGEREDESLIVRGWQRAGALAALLAPSDMSFPDPALAVPHLIYASKPTKRNGSRRPFETVEPLAEKLAIRVNTNYPKVEFDEMLEEVFLCAGVVLISWQHEFIPKIANRVLGDRTTAPQDWPEDRYDLIWVFDREPSTGLYSFTQVPQNLLMGVCAVPIRA